jgi:hypothetical protein
LSIPANTGFEPPPQTWLGALLRLWLLRPVAAPPRTDPARATLVMSVLWLAAWVAIDRRQSQPDPLFISGGIPLLAWYVLALLALAALLRRTAHPAPSFAPLLALSLGAVPVPLLFTSLAAAELGPVWFWSASIAAGVSCSLPGFAGSPIC